MPACLPLTFPHFGLLSIDIARLVGQKNNFRTGFLKENQDGRF
jgi:hypothetical protein